MLGFSSFSDGVSIVAEKPACWPFADQSRSDAIAGVPKAPGVPGWRDQEMVKQSRWNGLPLRDLRLHRAGSVSEAAVGAIDEVEMARVP